MYRVSGLPDRMIVIDNEGGGFFFRVHEFSLKNEFKDEFIEA